MKPAMITIEVLISFLILFLVISTSFSNINFFNIMIEKKINYEDEYITVLSLKDKLSSTICKSTLKEEGILNGFNYAASCEKINQLNTFTKGIEADDPSGNIGNHIVKLYKVNFELKKGTFASKHNYYITLSENLYVN